MQHVIMLLILLIIAEVAEVYRTSASGSLYLPHRNELWTPRATAEKQGAEVRAEVRAEVPPLYPPIAGEGAGGNRPLPLCNRELLFAIRVSA